MTGFQLVYVNHGGCHVWGGKFSLFPEHLILLPLGSHDFAHSLYTCMHYTLLNLSVLGLVYGLMTGLLPGLVWLLCLGLNLFVPLIIVLLHLIITAQESQIRLIIYAI